MTASQYAPAFLQAAAEEWRAIPGHEGSYEASSWGRIRSLDRIVGYKDGRSRFSAGQILRQTLNQRSHRYMVSLGFGGQVEVHVLVARTFLGPCPDGMECCHNDGDSTNNSIGNLRWDTHSENNRDRRRHGTDHNVNKTHCPADHPYDALNTYISPTGRRNCRTCRRDKKRAARANGARW